MPEVVRRNAVASRHYEQATSDEERDRIAHDMEIIATLSDEQLERLCGIGHNRPPPDLSHLERVIDERWSESIHDYPPHYAERIRLKAKYDCCKVVDQLTCRVYRTPTCEKLPWDFFVATCGCGRNHYRLLVEPFTITKPS